MLYILTECPGTVFMWGFLTRPLISGSATAVFSNESSWSKLGATVAPLWKLHFFILLCLNKNPLKCTTDCVPATALLPLTNIWQHNATPEMQLEFRLIQHYSNCWIFLRHEARDRQIKQGVIRSFQLKWQCWNKAGKAALIFQINYGLIEGILCCTPL